MSIRIATEHDVPQIRELVLSLSHYYLSDPQNELPKWFQDTLSMSAFSDRIASPEYRNYVFEERESIIGYICTRGDKYLYHLFVTTTFQGQGIASQLWRYVKKHSKSRSFSLRSSIFAVPVYKHFGFIESGPIGFKDGISYQPMELHEEEDNY